MAISVSIETLDDGPDGPYFISETDDCPHSFVKEMNLNRGVFMGTDAFIPLDRITAVWFDEIEETPADTTVN